MKVRIPSLSFLLVCLACFPVFADTLYDNGPINGTTDAWTIKFGFVVSDSFTLVQESQLNGLQFGAWLFPGDVLETVDVTITDAEFGGTTFLDATVNFTQSGCSRNQQGFNVCTETGGFDPLDLQAGTYWLNLQNATLRGTDNPVYWDENSGPSQASENSVGTIPSEAFTLLGTNGSTTSTTTVPEPGTVMLFGSGALGVAALLRRKVF